MTQKEKETNGGEMLIASLQVMACCCFNNINENSKSTKKTWDENVTDLPLLQDRELWQDLAPPDKQLTIFNLLKLIMSVMLKMGKISLFRDNLVDCKTSTVSQSAHCARFLSARK